MVKLYSVSLSSTESYRKSFTHLYKRRQSRLTIASAVFTQNLALCGGVGLFICVWVLNCCETIRKQHFISLIYSFVLGTGASLIYSLCPSPSLSIIVPFTNSAADFPFKLKKISNELMVSGIYLYFKGTGSGTGIIMFKKCPALGSTQDTKVLWPPNLRLCSLAMSHSFLCGPD